MSRLINDEPLKESIRKKTLFNKFECVLIDVVIDDQPTVDAIPIEWMLKWDDAPLTDELKKIGGTVNWNIVKWMILEWRKEHEQID